MISTLKITNIFNWLYYFLYYNMLCNFKAELLFLIYMLFHRFIRANQNIGEIIPHVFSFYNT